MSSLPKSIKGIKGAEKQGAGRRLKKSYVLHRLKKAGENEEIKCLGREELSGRHGRNEFATMAQSWLV